jgi:hypothetical protein
MGNLSCSVDKNSNLPVYRKRYFCKEAGKLRGYEFMRCPSPVNPFERGEITGFES